LYLRINQGLMKKLFLTPLACFQFMLAASAQPGQWTWMSGSSAVNSNGNFGVQGVPSPTNEPPASYEACEWTDANGDFWLYGGLTSAVSQRSDLWRYSPVANEWTWMRGPGVLNSPGSYGTQGIPSPTNEPPGKSWGMASWVDLNNNLWMFGGMSGGSFSDLWKYDVSANEWTWMKGPSTMNQAGVYGTQGVPSPANNPGGRWECAAAWTDLSGDLWLFGGYNGSTYNDLWRYSTGTNEWTWMKGSSLPGQSATYGTKGVEAPGNTPGSRMAYSHWVDGTGNLWLFGGYDGGANFFNDMWKFNPSTNNWTWMNGSNFGNAAGLYFGTCIDDSLIGPGNRAENRAAWVDGNGNFWEFGGTEDLSFGTCRNDLWMYCVATNRWTWVHGDSTLNPAGAWGTKGVSDPSNKPDGRAGAIPWKGPGNDIYFFGGTSNGWTDMYNDLWKFEIDPSCALCSAMPVALFSAPNHICPGTCTDFTNASVNATSYLWTFAGANPSTSTDENPLNICYNNPGTYSVTLIATNANGSDTLQLNNFITVYPYPAPQGIMQNGDTLFANQGAVSYQWYYNGILIPGATEYFYISSQNGDYNVVATDANGCEVEAAVFDIVEVPAFAGQEAYAVYPNPTREILFISGNSSTGIIGKISIYNMLGEKVLAVCCGLSGVDCRLLPPGMYYVEISDPENGKREKIFRTKFVKQ
jgi:PKD repeat protein